MRWKTGLRGILSPLSGSRREGPARPARLYRFSAKWFEKLKDMGISDRRPAPLYDRSGKSGLHVSRFEALGAGARDR